MAIATILSLKSNSPTEIQETTHHKMLKDPKEWEEYHRQYREARKTWYYSSQIAIIVTLKVIRLSEGPCQLSVSYAVLLGDLGLIINLASQ
jgi:hypothetical protein